MNSKVYDFSLLCPVQRLVQHLMDFLCFAFREWLQGTLLFFHFPCFVSLYMMIVHSRGFFRDLQGGDV